MASFNDLTHALTLHRPWHAAILLGPKRVENRTWAPPAALIGKRIWLHAGKTFDRAGAEHVLDHWPAAQRWPGGEPAPGMICGHARIVGVVQGGSGDWWITAGDKDRVRELMRNQQPWFFGSVGWVLDERTPLQTPIGCRGLQKLWPVPSDVLARVNEDVCCGG